MKSAGKARSNGLYRHIRTSKEIIRNLLNDSYKSSDIFYTSSRQNSLALTGFGNSTVNSPASLFHL